MLEGRYGARPQRQRGAHCGGWQAQTTVQQKEAHHTLQRRDRLKDGEHLKRRKQDPALLGLQSLEADRGFGLQRREGLLTKTLALGQPIYPQHRRVH